MHHINQINQIKMENLVSVLIKELECNGFISVTPKQNNSILIVIEKHVTKQSINGRYSNIIVEKLGNNRTAKTNVTIEVKEHSSDSYANIVREAYLIVKDKFVSVDEFKKIFN